MFHIFPDRTRLHSIHQALELPVAQLQLFCSPLGGLAHQLSQTQLQRHATTWDGIKMIQRWMGMLGFIVVNSTTRQNSKWNMTTCDNLSKSRAV